MYRDKVKEIAKLYGLKQVEAINMDSYVDEERTIRINFYYTSGTIMKQWTNKKKPIVIREATLEQIEELIDSK